MLESVVETARRRFVAFDDALDGGSTNDKDLLALNFALDELARLEPRQATIVESRFFGGAEFAEIGSQLGISEATVFREWRAARAWSRAAVTSFGIVLPHQDLKMDNARWQRLQSLFQEALELPFVGAVCIPECSV
jgi:hypothetical protein